MRTGMTDAPDDLRMVATGHSTPDGWRVEAEPGFVKNMNRKELGHYLVWLSNQAGSQKALAERLHISAAYLSDVINGRREPGEKLLSAIGIKMVVTYEHIDPQNDEALPTFEVGA